MDGTQQFLDVMIRYENILIMAATWILISVLGRVLPKWRETAAGARLLPIAPFACTSGLVWLPGLRQPEAAWGELLVLGIVLGWGSGHIHKLLLQSVLGRDAHIPKRGGDKPQPPGA